MSKRVTHLVLTRFAVKVKGAIDGVTPKVQPEPLSPAWLEGRFALFERYLLPSMKAQTFTDWTWRIFVHPDFDPALADRLRAYDPRIVVVSDPVTPLTGDLSGVVASTRIDSDDGFAAHALETVHRYAQVFAAGHERARMLRLKQGWWLDHATGQVYQSRGWSFLSLFERRAPYRGALVQSCDDIAKAYPEWRERSPLWLRVCHGGNVRNRFDVGQSTRSISQLGAEGFAWLPEAVAGEPEQEPSAAPAPLRVAIVMRTTERPKENYLKRTIAALVDQGVSGVRVQCSKVTDAAWVQHELGPLADSIVLMPADRDLSPNATGLAALASVDFDACDWVLLLEDDLQFCKRFVPSVQRWLSTHARADRNVFRFWGFHRPPNQRVHAFDHPLPQMAASQAVALRRDDARDFLAWATANLTTWRLPGKADPGVAFDKLIAAWSLARWPNRPGVLSWPFFVDHIGRHSSIHDRGGMGPGFAGRQWTFEGASA